MRSPKSCGLFARYKRCWRGRRHAFAVIRGDLAEWLTPKTDELVLFDTSKGSLNLGDAIIMHYCNQALKDTFNLEAGTRLTTHIQPSANELKVLTRARNKIVCGTNIMSPHFEWHSLWKIPNDLCGYRNIITLGVGWGCYCDETSEISECVYRTILSCKGLHSVRDSYTEAKFHRMGIHNVINTGCPTLWNLTREHCLTIPTKKADCVITTITDYAEDIEKDRYMLKKLGEQYGKVYVFIQGSADRHYLEKLIDLSDVELIDRGLEAFTAVLKSGNVDYVGTRLHAGIHALNCSVRTVIIAVDNRATEMGRDFNLPVIQRDELVEKLDRAIKEEKHLEIRVPFENIEKWKAQFGR